MVEEGVVATQLSEDFNNGQTRLNFQIVFMEGSVMAWVGEGSEREEQPGGATAQLRNMVLATNTVYEKQAVTASLISSGTEDPSDRMAARLATKLDTRIFLSCSINPSESPDVIAFAEKRLRQLIEDRDATIRQYSVEKKAL